EVAAKWILFSETGLPCAFVNVHHHLHAHPAVYTALLEVLPRDFSGWLRLGTPRYCAGARFGLGAHRIALFFNESRRRRCPYRTSQTLWGVDRLFQMRADEVRGVIGGLPPGLHEFVFHPRDAGGDADLSSLVALRSAGF